MTVVSHTSSRRATYFCCIFRNSKRFTWTKLFVVCVYICWLIIHCIQTEIYSMVNMKKRKWFIINCKNSDRSDGFFHKWKTWWASEQSQVLDEIFCQCRKKIVWACFAFVVWRLAKVNESECQQCLLGAYNCRIITLGLKTRNQLLV